VTIMPPARERAYVGLADLSAVPNKAEMSAMTEMSATADRGHDVVSPDGRLDLDLSAPDGDS
jgi:hypothetical protein